MKYVLPTLLAAGLAGLLPTAASATPLATEQHATTVSTAGDTIAWSSYDRGRYNLMLDRAGTVAVAPVAPNKTAFDVDLGTTKDGAQVAVYSRGGKLYQYDIAAGADKSLGIRGTHPSIADGRLAYVSRKAGQDRLFQRATDGKTTFVFSAPLINSVQLSADRLAFVTNNAPTKLLQTETLRVQRGSGRQKAIYEARSGGANTASIVGPTFDAGGKHLFWARRNLGSGTGNRYVRYTFASAKTAYAIGSDRNYSVSYADAERGFAVAHIAGDDDASRPGGPVIIDTTGALQFNAKP
jgi:hypothetical protein